LSEQIKGDEFSLATENWTGIFFPETCDPVSKEQSLKKFSEYPWGAWRFLLPEIISPCPEAFYPVPEGKSIRGYL
jgi:hypothetical protein